MTADRRCPLCGSSMIRSPRESATEFAKRQFCSRQCASGAKAARYDALLRPRLVRTERPEELPRKTCQHCGGVFVLHRYANGHREAPAVFAARSFCGKSCAMRYRAAHAAPVPAPQPDVRTTPGTGLTTIPKKKKAWPQGDPELCIFPARPVDYRDGYALMVEISAHNSSSCQPMLRGWTATIAEDATGLVVPRFERKETAALFDRMIENRTGRRAA